MSKRILFFGNEKLATGVETKAPVLSALINKGYQIAAIIVSESPSKLEDLTVVKLARKHGIEVLSPAKLSGFEAQIAAYKASSAVLAAYGKMVPSSVIGLFKVGIINIHPSLLPLHRGSTPVESVILKGEIETGVSLMKLVKAMDAGPIYAQQRISLSGNESKQVLADRLGKLGADMLVSDLENILAGNLSPSNQDNDLATYDKLISKEDSIINWQATTKQILNQFRAYQGWPRSRTHLGKIAIIVLEARSSNQSGKPGDYFIDEGHLGLYSKDGSVIIDSLIPEGKKQMSGSSFLAGYRSRL